MNRPEITAGEPSEEEVAAIVAALSVRAADAPSSLPAARTGAWVDRQAGLRTRLRPGPDAWRLSARR